MREIDQRICELLRVRKMEGMEFLFKEYYKPLVVWGATFVSDVQRSEDIVQEAFCALWNHREEMESVIHIKSFLYSVTRNTVLNYIKHQKIRLRYEQSLHDLEDKTLFEYFIIEEEVERILLKTQENLPPKCKRIFILAIQGKNNDEIAKELNISVNTVKTQKKIAYRTLKDYIYEITCLLFLLQK